MDNKNKASARAVPLAGSIKEPIDLTIESCVDERTAAKLLGVSTATLQKYRWLGGGPDYFKLGKKVSYRIGTLLEWRTSHQRSGSKEATV